MTEFETASLVLLEASLALREATLFTAIGHVVVALLIGLGQIAIVYYGIRAMQNMGKERAQEADKRDQADVRRHTEAMTALEALISRNSTPQGT